jgi:formate hydrogenlyase subunit 3/multisubunit Na+/H+ antiporter MnhD subunit
MMVYEGSELIGLLFRVYAVVLLSGIISIPFVPLRFKPIISIITVSLGTILTGYIAILGFTGSGIEYIVNGGSFFGSIPLRIDSLASWFILIVNFTSLTGVLYGAGYLKSSPVKPSVISFHWVLYITFQSSMVVVCMVQHSIAFIAAWEVMSLSSLFLVLFDYTNPKVLKAGINYLVQMHISVILLTVAFIWVYFKTGTFDFRGVSEYFGSEINIWLFLVFFAGFGLKSGFLGLHTWLPQAHPAAPSHISGVMSGVIVKMGIYGIFRVITYLKSDYLILGEIILTLSLITGLFGIVNAAVHRDFKKLLAYCTIENIGIIGIGIGIGLIGLSTGQPLLSFFGFGGALLHVLNHSLFKSLLFFSAGSVYRQTHTRDMDKLGGLIKSMPKSAAFFLIGSVAIGGIPPLNGFISEFMIYCGILKGIDSAGISQITLMILTFAGLSVIGGVSILTFTKTFGTIFLGSPRQKLMHEPTEVSFLMILPQYIIVAVMLFIAFVPGYFISILGTMLNSSLLHDARFDMVSLSGYIGVLKNISLASLLFLLIMAFVFILRKAVVRDRKEEYSSTWGCGYPAPDPKMQYTGKSFSKSFGKLLNFVIIEKKGYTEIARDETFPGSRKYRSFYLDIIENKIIDPVVLVLTRFINLFQFIQNGRIQAYVIYGIVFILVIFLGTILNLWH